ncbi:MAG: nucleotidyltransferase family protein [Gammaproteobacteria bacterium]
MDETTQKVVNFVTLLANELIHPRKIILFGSRARGDARQTSDVDIAFDFDPDQYQQHWSRFCLNIEENAPTLLSIDLINMNEISSAFSEKIRAEGIVVYTRALS